MRLPDNQQNVYQNPHVPGPRLQGGINVQTNAGMFGGQQGQNLQFMGQQVQQAAHQAAYLYDDYNSAKAQEAASALHADFLAWQREAGKRLGKDGVSTGDDYAKWSRARISELTHDLNPVQKARFQVMTADRITAQQRWASDYGTEQSRRYTLDGHENAIAVNTEDIQANVADPEMWDKAKEAIKDHAFSIGLMNGWDEEKTSRSMQESVQNALLKGIGSLLKQGDTGTAAAVLDHYAKELDPDLFPSLKAEFTRAREHKLIQVCHQKEQERTHTAEQSLDARYRAVMSDAEGLPREAREREIRSRLKDSPALSLRFESDLAFERKRQDAATQESLLLFRDKVRKENLSPSAALAEIEAGNYPDEIRTALRREMEWGGPVATEANAELTMDLMRAVERGNLTQEDVLAASLCAGLTDGQTIEAYRHQKAKSMGDFSRLSVSRLDDICLDLGMAPNANGVVRAPAWMYTRVRDDLRRHGLPQEDKPLTDEILAASVTRVFQRHDAEMAAQGPILRKIATAGAMTVAREGSAFASAEDSTLASATPVSEALPDSDGVTEPVEEQEEPVLDPDGKEWARQTRDKILSEFLETYGIREVRRTVAQYAPVEPPENLPRAADSTVQYYCVGRRPLAGAYGDWLFTFQQGLFGAQNLRLEHQQFIRSDGANFGFFATSEVEVDNDKLHEYLFDIPYYSETKYRADCIDQARDMIAEEDKKNREGQFEAYEKNIMIHAMPFRYSDEYCLWIYNCQMYINRVLKMAEHIANNNKTNLVIY